MLKDPVPVTAALKKNTPTGVLRTPWHADKSPKTTAQRILELTSDLKLDEWGIVRHPPYYVVYYRFLSLIKFNTQPLSVFIYIYLGRFLLNTMF
jgi:hypothetical protein